MSHIPQHGRKISNRNTSLAVKYKAILQVIKRNVLGRKMQIRGLLYLPTLMIDHVARYSVSLDHLGNILLGADVIQTEQTKVNLVFLCPLFVLDLFDREDGE